MKFAISKLSNATGLLFLMILSLLAGTFAFSPKMESVSAKSNDSTLNSADPLDGVVEKTPAKTLLAGGGVNPTCA